MLDRHGLTGPYVDVPGVEAAVRVGPDGSRLLFLLNHGAEPVELTADLGGVDLLSGRLVEPGRPVRLDAGDVMVIRGRG